MNPEPGTEPVIETAAVPPPARPRRRPLLLGILLLLVAWIVVPRLLPQSPMEVRDISETLAGETRRVRIQSRNLTEAALPRVVFELQVLGKDGQELASSLNCLEMNGPWVGNVPNVDGAILYAGQQSYEGYAVLAYDIGAGATANCEFILTDQFTAKYGEPDRYTVRIRQLGGTSRVLGESTWMTPMLGALTRFLEAGATHASTGGRDPLMIACLIPLVLWLLSWLPFLGPDHSRPLLPAAPRARRWWRAIDLLIMLALFVLFSIYLLRTLPGTTAGREPDSFDYLCIAERFGPPLDAAIRGMDDRGYDRRAYLHEALDRGWGYPVMISLLARVSGDPATDCGPLFYLINQVNVATLLLTSGLVALLFYRHWTRSAWPGIRAGLVFAFLLFDGYNYDAVHRVLTEVPSRFIFSVCLLSWAAFWTSRSPRWQRVWIVVGTLMAYVALTFRTEHTFVEPVIMPLVVFFKFRTPAWRGNLLTWLLCAFIGGLAVVGVSYTKYRTWKPATGSGLHLLGAVHRLSKNASVTTLTLPPGVNVTDEQRRIYEELVVPAAKHPGGYANPSIAMPAVVTNMTPMELSAFMSDYSMGILKQNKELWWHSSYQRYRGLVITPNNPWPYEDFTNRLQLAMNRFGLRNPAWSWPFWTLVWIVGRWLWGRRYRYDMRAAPLIIITMIIALHVHALVTTAVGAGELRQRHFISGFFPAVGTMIALESLDLLLRQLSVMVVRLGRMLRGLSRKPEPGPQPAP